MGRKRMAGFSPGLDVQIDYDLMIMSPSFKSGVLR